jgi:hypothetical protein
MDVFGDLAFGGIRRAFERFRQRRPEKKFARIDREDDFYLNLGYTARQAVMGEGGSNFDAIKPNSLWQRRQKREVIKATKKAAPARHAYSQMAAANKRLDPVNREILAQAKEQRRIGQITNADYNAVQEAVQDRYENWGTSDTKPVNQVLAKYASGTRTIERVTRSGPNARIRKVRLDRAARKADEAPQKAQERHRKRQEKVQRKKQRQQARQAKRNARQQDQDQQPPTNP